MKLIRLFAVLLLVLASNVFGQEAQVAQLDVSKLSPEQRQALTEIAKGMETKETNVPEIIDALKTVDASTAKEWAEAGTEAGRAVANFAKEIGVVAKDFLDSFVGQVLFVLIAINYGGGTILQYTIDLFFFLLVTPVFAMFMYRLFRFYVLKTRVTYEIKYHSNPFFRVLGFNEKTRKEELKDQADADVSLGTSVVTVIFIAILTVSYFAGLWPEMTL